jgi:hypothetical protein
MTKNELLESIRVSRAALTAVLESVPPARRNESGVCGAWSVKDVLVHLTYWEGQLVTLLFQLRNGAPLSGAQFSGKSIDEINTAWYQQGRSRAWEPAWNDFIGLGVQIPRRVNEFSEAELNSPKLHPKLRGQPLSAWIRGYGCEHEDEHRAAIEVWLKATHPS